MTVGWAALSLWGVHLKLGSGALLSFVEPDRGGNSAHRKRLIKVDCGLRTEKRPESHVSGGGEAPGRCGVSAPGAQTPVPGSSALGWPVYTRDLIKFDVFIDSVSTPFSQSFLNIELFWVIICADYSPRPC